MPRQRPATLSRRLLRRTGRIATDPFRAKHISLASARGRGLLKLRSFLHPLVKAPWVIIDDDPSPPNPLPSFRFFAVLGTWMEADVVEACVRNAKTQGCERVYVVDNDSPDDTVSRAEAAGAELVRTFRTEEYDELLRVRLMNEVVAEVSAAEDDGHIWWLWLDADEFAHGPNGLTLREHLERIDSRCRIVGTTVFNHYPTDEPHYVEGDHPLDHQPYCEKLTFDACPAKHRKHPLQRWDRSGPPIECSIGFHRATSPRLPLIESAQAAFLHHFPFRREDVSRVRLDLLCSKDAGGASRAKDHDWATEHILLRYRSCDAVYRQRWAEVEKPVFPPGPRNYGVELSHWEELVDPEHRSVARWYSRREADGASAAAR